jgi:alkaline phosphatase
MRSHFYTRQFALGLIIASLVFTTPYWASAQSQEDNTTPLAKNVILMIADGAGFNAFLAGAYYQYGDAALTPYADFPVQCGMATFAPETPEAAEAMNADGGIVASDGYNPNYIWDTFNNCRRPVEGTVVTDSAAAGTVLYTGEKTTNGRVSMSADGEIELATMAELADQLGKATGAVSSVEISHATPACVAAHNVARGNYAEIAEQMLTDSPLDVIMGAGHPDAAPLLTKPAARSQYVGGDEVWADLTDEDGLNGFFFITEKSAFEHLAEGLPSICSDTLALKVAGVPFAYKTINESSDSMEPPANVPTLEVMSRGALNVLNHDPDGFFVMIEGGAVDWANHANDFPTMLREMVEFNMAVEAVVDWVETNSSWNETLLIITADHETGQLWGADAYDDANDDQRFDPQTETFNAFAPPANAGQGVIPDVLYGYGSHTNHLVPVWAIGPGCETLLDSADETDPQAAEVWNFSGRYIHNTELAPAMRGAVGAE